MASCLHDMSMMRLELIHPMVVHFPIALLFTGVALRIVSVIFRKWSFLVPTSWTLIVLGTVAGAAAIIAGELAKDIVAKTVCDPSLIDCHEQYAYATAWIFSGACVLQLVKVLQKRFQRVLLAAIWILLLSGSVTLGITAKRGAEVVYQMGAAVNCGNR